MKNLCAASLTLVVVLILVQSPRPSETLKIKKVVKDAAKLSKKYGYLLASRKKKLYAVPFPMPLPVFVKRQHIYTQVPIIPRYVQHPQPYGSPAHSAETSSYEPMASLPTSSSASNLYEASSEASPQRSRTKKGAPASSSSSGSSSASSSQQDTPTYLGGTGSSATSTGKYLSQLASILGQSVPIFGNAGNANRDLLTKLLNGQAKVLPPTSLISAIKGPSAALMKYQQQQDSSSQEQDQDSKGETGSTASDHSQSTSANADTTKSPPESSSSPAETNRPSASELHRSRYRVPYYAAMRNPYGLLADPRRVPAGAMLASPMVSPFAALAAAQSSSMMPRIPISQMAAASQYLAMLDPNASQLDQMEPQSSEPNELAANPIRQGQQSQTADEQATIIDQNQLLEQRRRLLKLALIKERQEAERLLESRLVLARAKQISQQLGQQLPSAQQQAAQLMNQLRQQQVAQQLQQMRYLQLVQQHQQQLQHNTIDNQ